MVSALIESKRVREGIQAAAAIDDTFLVIAGDGPLRDEIDATCATLLPGRHRRMTLPARRMPELYNSADVLLHMSQAESFGNVYVEGLCSGLPIVGHDYAVTRWILGDDHPGLVDTTHVSAVSRAIGARAPGWTIGGCPFGRSSSDAVLWSNIARQYHEFLLTVVAG